MRRTAPKPAYALLVVLAVAAAAGSPAASAIEPAKAEPALAALVSGGCTVTSGDAARPLRLLDTLPAGARVATGRDGRLVVVFFGGERFELDGDSSAVVGDGRLVETRGGVRSLPPVSPRVALAPLAASPDVSRRAGAVRVRGEQGLAMYPSDGAALVARSPVLRFGVAAGAERYSVAVEDEAGNTVFSAQTSANRVALPQDVLRDGAVYFWRVRARGPGLSGAGREERFVTLSPDETRRWDDARAALSPADPSLRNLLAATASALGLRREACLAAGDAGAAGPLANLGCGELSPLLAGE